MIHVIAKITTAAGQRDTFIAEFQKVVPSVLAEAGCVQYTPTIDAVTDIDGQQSAGADTVVIIEQWETIQALRDHLVADHMTAYRERVQDLITGLHLEIFESV